MRRWCPVSCVHQTAILDRFRERSRLVLTETIAARQERDPAWRPAAVLKELTWVFLDGPFSGDLGKAAVRLLGS